MTLCPSLPVFERLRDLFEVRDAAAVAVPLLKRVCAADDGLDAVDASVGLAGLVLGRLGDGQGFAASGEGGLVFVVSGGDIASGGAGTEASAASESAVGVELPVPRTGDVAVGGGEAGSERLQVPFGAGDLPVGVRRGRARGW